MALDLTPIKNGNLNLTPLTPTSAKPDPLASVHVGGTSTANNIWAQLANTAVGGASDLGVHLGQAIAPSIAAGAGALGFKGEQQKILSRLNDPSYSKNLLGQPVKPLQGGTAGLEQLAGDTLKTGSELSAIAAAPVSVGGAVLAGAGIGASQAAGSALQNDASAKDVVKQGAIGGVIGGASGGAAAGIGQFLGVAGNYGLRNLIKPSKADVADGFSLDTIKQYKLGGTLYQMQDKTQRTINDLSGQLREKLTNSDSHVDLNAVLAQTVKAVTGSGSKLKTFGANTRMESALSQLSSEASAIEDAGSLSVPDAQLVKQAAGQFGSWQYGKTDPDAKASEMVYNAFYNKLKTAIEDSAPEGVKEINQQLSKLIPVSNAIVRRIPVAERAAPLSLTDFIGLTASTFEPHALGITLLNFLSKNGIVANKLINAPTVGHVIAPYASLFSASSNTSSPQQ